MPYKNILTENGFTMFKSCRCNGSREEHYKQTPPTSVMFVVKPHIKTLKTKINGRVVCVTDLENLQSEIDKYL